MNTRLCWTAGLVGSFSLAAVWFAAAQPGGTGGASGPDDRGRKWGTESLAVEKVTVTPATQPGSARVRAQLSSPATPGVTPLARVAQNATLNGGLITADVQIDVPQLVDDQRQYLASLNASNKVTRYVNRRRVTEQAPRLVAPAAVAAAGGAVELAPFVGTPDAAGPQATAPAADNATLISRSLMITDLSVVEDPVRTAGNGVWTFGHLMTQLANPQVTGLDPATFARRWIETWRTDQTINGLTVAKREKIDELIIKWEQDSGGPALQLDKAPFRLLAIVSRLDLRNNLVLGVERIGGSGAGEARFVFCAVDAAGKALPFTVIFEYGVKKENFAAVRAWAEQWYRLSDPALPFPSPQYNQRLQEITDQFAAAGVDPEAPPNRSALSQLRTNEIALASPWEIREFRLDVGNTGYLRQVTVKQTPDEAFQNKQALADFINAQEQDILNSRHSVPVERPAGTPFLDGSALTPLNFAWEAPGVAGEARHAFSLISCNGCHARETFVNFTGPDPAKPPTHFTHVAPREQGQAALLSAFLTGKDAGGQPYELPDPFDPMVKRAFADLDRRADDLRNLVTYGGFYEKSRLPLQMVH